MYFAPPLKGLPLELGIGAGGQKKTRMMGLPDGRKSFKIGLTHLDTIPACDGQTDRRTRCRSKDRAMLCVARVKIEEIGHSGANIEWSSDENSE